MAFRTDARDARGQVAGVEIIAHRGASHAAPENTLAAAHLAWKEGADALELDLRLTADGQLAVVHDEDLQRLAGSPAKVSQTTLAQLQSLEVGRWKHPRFAGEKIPSLPEILATLPAGKRVFIEVKEGPAAIGPLAATLRLSRIDPARVIIIAFDFDTAAAAKKNLLHSEVAWIVDYRQTPPPALDTMITRCRAASLDALDLSATWPIDRTVVERIHGAGLKLYVWTVDESATARRLTAAGVDGITTNRPGWLRAQLVG